MAVRQHGGVLGTIVVALAVVGLSWLGLRSMRRAEERARDAADATTDATADAAPSASVDAQPDVDAREVDPEP